MMKFVLAFVIFGATIVIRCSNLWGGILRYLNKNDIFDINLNKETVDIDIPITSRNGGLQRD